MKNLVLVSLFVVLLSSCATGGRMGALPEVDENMPSGEIIVIRKSSFVGAAISYYVTVDGEPIFSILSGKHTKFVLAPGSYRIGVQCFGGWTPTWKEDSIEINIGHEETKYVFISPNMRCAGIEELDAQLGKRRMESTKFVEY